MLAALLGLLLLAPPPDTSWKHADLRTRMVERQVAARGITSPTVLRAMRSVPRHRFVPGVAPELAYTDRPLPLGHDQTISQPCILARMTALVTPDASDRVLEIGTGSGYQAAVLSTIVDSVYTLENPRAGRHGHEAAPPTWLRQRFRPQRRWLRGLAEPRAVRRDHRHGRARRDSAAPPRPARGRGPDDRAGGPDRRNAATHPRHEGQRRHHPTNARARPIRPVSAS